MADRSSDLEIFRESFLHELAEAQPDLSGYQDYLKFWKSVEAEAAQTEDLGVLDNWVRDLARDKEKVAALRARADTMTSDKGGSTAIQALASILKMVLDILESVERRLRRMRDDRLSALASMLWKGGPGTLVKPKPDEKDKDKKPAGGGGAADKAAKAVLPAQQPKQPELKRDNEKKMER